MRSSVARASRPSFSAGEGPGGQQRRRHVMRLAGVARRQVARGRPHIGRRRWRGRPSADGRGYCSGSRESSRSASSKASVMLPLASAAAKARSINSVLRGSARKRFAEIGRGGRRVAIGAGDQRGEIIARTGFRRSPPASPASPSRASGGPGAMPNIPGRGRSKRRPKGRGGGRAHLQCHWLELSFAAGPEVFRRRPA